MGEEFLFGVYYSKKEKKKKKKEIKKKISQYQFFITSRKKTGPRAHGTKMCN